MNLFKYPLFIAVLAVVSLVSCSKSEENSQAANSEDPRIAVYAYNSEPILDWDPSVMFSNGIIVLSNVYETLLRYDAVNDEIIPILAESYSTSQDNLTWTFNIRKGVKFHDGTDLNAEAVKYSIDRTIRLQKGASYIWSAVNAVNVKDEYTVEFALDYPAPVDLIATTGYAAYIFSPSSVTSDDSDWFAQGRECGTGPYMLQSQVPGDKVVLTKFEDYWQGWEEGQYDKVVFQKISETSSRRQLIEKGDADVTLHLPPEDIGALKNDPNVRLLEEQSYTNVAAYFNTQKAPLDNPQVRKALSYAFPYQDVLDYVLGGYGSQSRGPIPVGLWGYGKDLMQYELNLDKARELLAKAGYPDGGFDLLYTYTAGLEEEKKAAELFRAELFKLGINLEIRGMPWDSQWELAKGPEESRQDMLTMMWWPDYPSPISWMWNLYHSEEEPFFNLAYYSNPDVDLLIEDADVLSAVNKEEASALFVKAQEKVIDDAAAIFQFDMVNVWVFSKSFKGFIPNPAYSFVVFFYDAYKE